MSTARAPWPQPGTMALADNGDILLPEAGPDKVLRIDHTTLPAAPLPVRAGISAAVCGTSVFFQGTSAMLPFVAGVAHDPTCDCYAISSFFGDPAIAWFNNQGQPEPDRTPVPGAPLAQLGKNPERLQPVRVGRSRPTEPCIR